MSGRRTARLSGLALLLAGASLCVTALAGYAAGWIWQRHPPPPRAAAPPVEGGAPPAAVPGDAYARLRIPSIDLDVTVVEGTRELDLLKAPGHLLASGPPGGPGNCVIAGHRDLHFRKLGRLRRGDEVELESGGAVARYRVESAKVAAPTEHRLLDSRNGPLLTLITCYPFGYVGPAPLRYVVQARLTTSDRLSLR